MRVKYKEITKKLLGQQPEKTEFHFLRMDLRRMKEDNGEALLMFPRCSFITFFCMTANILITSEASHCVQIVVFGNL